MLLLLWLANYSPTPNAKDQQTTRAHRLHVKDKQTTRAPHACTSLVVHGRSAALHDLLRRRLGHLPAPPPHAPADTQQHDAGAAKAARTRKNTFGHVRVRPPQPRHDRPPVPSAATTSRAAPRRTPSRRPTAARSPASRSVRGGAAAQCRQRRSPPRHTAALP